MLELRLKRESFAKMNFILLWEDPVKTNFVEYLTDRSLSRSTSGWRYTTYPQGGHVMKGLMINNDQSRVIRNVIMMMSGTFDHDALSTFHQRRRWRQLESSTCLEESARGEERNSQARVRDKKKSSSCVWYSTFCQRPCNARINR